MLSTVKEVFMVFPLKRKIVYPLFFFVFFWFTAFPLFADEDKEKDKESDREVVLRVGQWEFDFEGQVRLRMEGIGNFTEAY